MRLILFAEESISDLTEALCVFLLPSILVDKKTTRKPPRFSCLLPDPRELIEIKNKKKVYASTLMWVSILCRTGLSQRMHMG